MLDMDPLVNDYEEELLADTEEPDDPSNFRYRITAYGADYPVDALVKRIESKDIIVPTFDPEVTSEDIIGFQRQFVWTRSQSDRFIESLLLGLPVPGIFLVVQDDGRLLVLDGQQRLRTLHSFYTGIIRGRAHKLEKVQKEFEGKTYKTLGTEDRRRLDNSIIHATVVRQDEPSGDQSSVYMVFERLNTGGTALQPQEIRVALYGGSFTRFLREMNEFGPWREIYGKKSPRLKDQELILRFFALLHRSDEYQRPMKDFLNYYASANREFQLQEKEVLESIFQSTIITILQSLGPRAFRLKNAINVAVMDSVMVGIANRIQTAGPIKDLNEVASRYATLIANEEFFGSIERSTTDERSVAVRLEATKEAMRELS